MAQNRIPVHAALLGFAFGTGFGCADRGDDTGGDSNYDALSEEQAKNWDIMCECFEELGYESEEECSVYGYGAGPSVPPPLQECISEILGQHDEDDTAIQCQLEAVQDFNACVAALSCEDRFGGYYYGGYEFYECYYGYFEAIDACPEIPYSVDAEVLETCYGQKLKPPFTCDNGEEIPEDWVCDYEEDCEDGSDEQQDCPACIDEIPPDYICDGYPDCPDGSDEDQNCPACVDQIPPDYICDGYEDCPDGSDEANCSLPAEPNMSVAQG
jgi:hypothetical protein